MQTQTSTHPNPKLASYINKCIRIHTPPKQKKTGPSKLEFLELYETPAALFLLGTDQRRVRVFFSVCVSVCVCVWGGVTCMYLVYRFIVLGWVDIGWHRAWRVRMWVCIYISCLVSCICRILTSPYTPTTNTQHAYHVLRMDRRVPVGPRTPLNAVVSLVCVCDGCRKGGWMGGWIRLCIDWFIY